MKSFSKMGVTRHPAVVLTAALALALLAGCSGPAAGALPTTEAPTATSATSQPDEMLDEQIATWQAENAATPTEDLSETPTQAPSATAADTATPKPSPDDWQSAPVIPGTVSERAVEIYLRGLELGRNPHAFSKVGDCGGTPSWFLGSFDLGPKYYSLSEYDYLTPAIDYYAGSFERYSLAVNPGFNASSVFAPLWADREVCESDEGPLACEYRVHNPSVALIMLGTNDRYHIEDFEPTMRKLIEFSIEGGVLPVLASKADNLEGDGSINRIIYKLALEYELPFWNFWRAVQELPDQGLQEDGAHLTWAPNFFDDSRVMKNGWPWRNLTALQTLYAVWEGLPDEAAESATTP